MSDDDGFPALIYRLIQLIPEGKVTSYGHIAFLAMKPNNARQVGTILKQLSINPTHQFNTVTVPWWRVINASGYVSSRPGKQAQIDKLRSEIPVGDTGSVALGEYGWFPDLDDVDIDALLG